MASKAKKWTIIDAPLILTFVLDLDLPYRGNGVAKFVVVYEIGDFRQGKADNFSENWLLQLIWNCIFRFL